MPEPRAAKRGRQRGKDPWEGCGEGRAGLHHLSANTLAVWAEVGEAVALLGTPGLCGSITAQGSGVPGRIQENSRNTVWPETPGTARMTTSVWAADWHPPKRPVTQAGPALATW